jgi:hypothetical protein
VLSGTRPLGFVESNITQQNPAALCNLTSCSHSSPALCNFVDILIYYDIDNIRPHKNKIQALTHNTGKQNGWKRNKVKKIQGHINKISIQNAECNTTQSETIFMNRQI